MSDYCTPTRLLALATLHERDDEGRAIAQRDAEGARTVARARTRRADESIGARGEGSRTRAVDVRDGADACAGTGRRARLVRRHGRASDRQGPGLRRRRTGSRRRPARQNIRTDRWRAKRCARSRASGRRRPPPLVARQIREARGDRHSAAEDALWHFPPAQTATQVRELLRSREFVLSHPQTAARLIDRAGQSRVQGLDDTLTKLEGLRFRFWKPSLVQVALKAGSIARDDDTGARAGSRSARGSARARQSAQAGRVVSGRTPDDRAEAARSSTK